MRMKGDSPRGIISLDIDGTITTSKYDLDPEITTYLEGLIEKNWVLIFVTGRTFSFAAPVLSSLRGTYFLAVQNGSALYKMPGAELIKKQMLPISCLPELDLVFRERGGGLLVESGYLQGDICYFKPGDYTQSELEYVNYRKEMSPEPWEPLDDFENLTLQEFAVGKYFADKEEAEEIADQVRKIAPFKVIVIRDPFKSGGFLAHINAPRTSKGEILSYFASHYPEDTLIIGAGDDYNDVEMLERCRFKIVMENAPKPLHVLADVIAPPVDAQGIIPALEEAIKWKG